MPMAGIPTKLPPDTPIFNVPDGLVRKDESEIKSKRDTWKQQPLTFGDLESAIERARERLADNPIFIERQELLGRERALIYKTMVLTGLRKAELASLTVAHLDLDVDPSYLTLNPADELVHYGDPVDIAELTGKKGVGGVAEWKSIRAQGGDHLGWDSLR